MQNYATATIEGFVTHPPTVKTTKTGKSLCTFSLAVNHYSKKDELPQVSYIDVETWEKIAESCSKNIEKGKRVLIIGAIRQDRWENAEGQSRSRLKIIGKEVRILESKKNLNANQEQPAPV